MSDSLFGFPVALLVTLDDGRKIVVESVIGPPDSHGSSPTIKIGRVLDAVTEAQAGKQPRWREVKVEDA